MTSNDLRKGDIFNNLLIVVKIHKGMIEFKACNDTSTRYFYNKWKITRQLKAGYSVKRQGKKINEKTK